MLPAVRQKLPSIDNLLSLSVYFTVSINDILCYPFNNFTNGLSVDRAA